MLVINKFGPAKVNRVVLEPERVVVRLTTGKEIVYRKEVVGDKGNSVKEG